MGREQVSQGLSADQCKASVRLQTTVPRASGYKPHGCTDFNSIQKVLWVPVDAGPSHLQDALVVFWKAPLDFPGLSTQQHGTPLYVTFDFMREALLGVTCLDFVRMHLRASSLSVEWPFCL